MIMSWGPGTGMPGGAQRGREDARRAVEAGELRVRYFWRESDTLKKFNYA